MYTKTKIIAIIISISILFNDMVRIVRLNNIATTNDMVEITQVNQGDNLDNETPINNANNESNNLNLEENINEEIANPTPEPTPMPEPTPKPTPKPETFIPDTLKTVLEYDYIGNSVTGLSKKQLTLKETNNKFKSYGKLVSKGMPYSQYKDAMTYIWEDCTDYENKPVKINIDITQTINYDKYVDILKKLSCYDGVYLYKIGKSYEGRDIYAIEIDVESDTNKDVFMLTGQVHAREFAGGTFVIKMLADLIQDAQTNKKTMNLLKSNKYVAVPIINVDGREALITNPSKWTKGGEMLKAYTNGTDGNRNFPGLMWGQVSKGNSLKWNVEKSPGIHNYPGDYGGSNPETKAMIKWIYHYVVIDKAKCLLDFHQQGTVIYAGKKWITTGQDEYSNHLRTQMFKLLNNNKASRKYGRIQDEPKYGLEGTGSTVTDYAISLAAGSKFSPSLGFGVITDGKRERILMEFNDLDNVKFAYEEPNSVFASLTIEIGIGKKYLGNSKDTRNLLAKEYKTYNFGKILYQLPDMIKK